MKTWIDTAYFTELQILQLAEKEQKRIVDKMYQKASKKGNEENWQKYARECNKLGYLNWKINRVIEEEKKENETI